MTLNVLPAVRSGCQARGLLSSLGSLSLYLSRHWFACRGGLGRAIAIAPGPQVLSVQGEPNCGADLVGRASD